MPSTDPKADAIAVFNEHRNALIAGAALLVLLLLLNRVGGHGVLGGLVFALYGLVWILVTAFVLWLFYRLVVAVERIASAQERIADAHERQITDEG
ncbi:MAG: hypothetical protein ABEH90_07085 [Halolamina sp.]